MTALEITQHNNRNSEHQLIWHGVWVWTQADFYNEMRRLGFDFFERSAVN